MFGDPLLNEKLRIIDFLNMMPVFFSGHMLFKIPILVE